MNRSQIKNNSELSTSKISTSKSSQRIIKPVSKPLSPKGDLKNKYETQPSKNQTKDPQILKYETMLKTVNDEFQIAVKKNRDLSNQLYELEYKLDKTTQDLSKAQKFIDIQHKAKKDINRSVEIEKSDLEKQTQSLTLELSKKAEEIDRLKAIQFDLENKIIMNQSESWHSLKSESESKRKIDKLLFKYGDLDAKVREKDAEIYKVNTVNEALRRELEKARKIEAKYNFDFNALANENRSYKQENENLREKMLKSSTILKQTISETEDLKRELNMIKGTFDLNKVTERNLHDENYLLKTKIQKLDGDNSQLENKIYNLNNQQDDVLAELLSLERSIGSGLLDQTGVMSKLDYIINSMKLKSESSKISSRSYYEESSLTIPRIKFETPRIYNDTSRERSLTDYSSQLIPKFR